MSDAEHFLRRALVQRERVWDIGFFDPPYATPYAAVLEAFGTSALLRPKGGVLVAEHRYDNPLPEQSGALKRWRIIRQGESCLRFYERK